jgi:hypothetical protein
MKALLALVPLALLGATQSTLAPNSTLYSDGTPPVRFQGEAAEVVVFVNDVEPYCGKAENPNYRIIACTGIKDGTPVTVLPNPCAFNDQYYAHIACHEKGHVLGWPATHGD